jgi:hypothetical protein
MPCYSTDTEEEAERLLINCRLDYDGFHRVTVDWKDGDILAAMDSAVRQLLIHERNQS